VSFDPATFAPEHFLWDYADGVAMITLNRPERKNPLTFESYEELRTTFYNLDQTYAVKAVVIAGAGGNFCSGGDVHEIIGPLTKMDHDGLIEFTTMTGDLVRAMRACPQPIIAAVDGVCAGAGAILAMPATFGSPPQMRKRPSCLPASASAVRTWARARSCRGSSATAAPPSCCSPAAT